MKYLHLSLIQCPFMSWFSAAVLINKLIPKLGHRKSECERLNLDSEPQAKSSTLLSWPRSSTQGWVILSIVLCFLLGSRCPARGLCLAAAQCHHGKERFSPCWLLLTHLLKGEKLWGCCLVPWFPGLLLMWGAPQNDTGNLYLLSIHSVTTLTRECSFFCLYWMVFSEGRLFGPQKSCARTCTCLIRG